MLAWVRSNFKINILNKSNNINNFLVLKLHLVIEYFHITDQHWKHQVVSSEPIHF